MKSLTTASKLPPVYPSVKALGSHAPNSSVLSKGAGVPTVYVLLATAQQARSSLLRRRLYLVSIVLSNAVIPCAISPACSALLLQLALLACSLLSQPLY